MYKILQYILQAFKLEFCERTKLNEFRRSELKSCARIKELVQLFQRNNLRSTKMFDP